MKCLVIYNQKCGKFDIVKGLDVIVSALRTKYEVVDKKASFFDGETREIARDACGKYDVVVVAGGDGTLHEVICGIAPMEQKPKIGIIPAGTINDVSRSLKISRNLKKALKTILNGKTMKHDLFKVNDEYGIYASAAGLLTDISYKVSSKPKRKIGKLAYYFSIPKFLFGHKAIDGEFTIDDKVMDKKFSLMLFLNSKSVAGRKVDKNNNLNDGKAKLIIFNNKKSKIGLLSILKIVFFFGFGLKKRTKDYEVYEVEKFSMKLDGETNLNIDGEKIIGERFEFEVLHPGVEIFVNKKV